MSAPADGDPMAAAATAPVGLEPLREVLAVAALCPPPVGWRAEPLKHSGRHRHQLWISPSGRTAYGVIQMDLPLPVGPDLVLIYGFLPEMKRIEGRAALLSRRRDAAIDGLRVVAEGGLYVVRASIVTRGWQGWVVYAGTERDKPVDEEELRLAELAREHTLIGATGGAVSTGDPP